MHRIHSGFTVAVKITEGKCDNLRSFFKGFEDRKKSVPC